MHVRNSGMEQDPDTMFFASQILEGFIEIRRLSRAHRRLQVTYRVDDFAKLLEGSRGAEPTPSIGCL